MYCSRCGAANSAAVTSCSQCGIAWPRVAPVQPVIVPNPKNSGIAVVLSFFITGLGQIYNGEIGKGILFIVLSAISWLAMFILIGFVTTPLLWIWGMIDAYQVAERINQESKAQFMAVAGIR